MQRHTEQDDDRPQTTTGPKATKPQRDHPSRPPPARGNKKSKPVEQTQKKKKFQKPKHLKRKLETVEDEAKKEEIQKQMEQLEQKKRPRITDRATISKNRSQGTLIDSTLASKNTEHDSHNNKDLPRTTTKQTKSQGARHEPTLPTSKNTDRESRKEKDFPEASADANDSITDFVEEGPMAAVVTTVGSPPASLIVEKVLDKGKEDDDSDAESLQDAPTQQRQRGKRRRGRQDTSKIVEEKIPEVEKSPKKTVDNDSTRKPTINQKDRRCIGRKPITDFKIGQSYPGTVVYVKPFGVFFDIGCHSDAFCHVSRLSDDFVESPEALFQPGAKVEGARVVEIDRKRKRVTVSLQSEARVEDERASMEARKERREKHHRAFSSGSKLKSKEAVPSKPKEQTNALKQDQHFRTTASNEQQGSEPSSRDRVVFAAIAKPESEMTPAELKRARKLERRAARREQATKQ